MSKYFAVLKTSLKQESKTLVDSIVTAFSFIVIIFIFNELWGYIYGDGGIGEVINGYSLKMMLWYLIMAEILMYSVNCRQTTKAFAYDIKTGKIAYSLNKPYNYFCFQISNSAGIFLWKQLFLIPSGILIGLVIVGPIEGFSVAYIFPLLLSLIFGTILNCIMYGGIGLLCFWIEESTPFTWILQKFNMLFGLFFPPEFFPGILQKIITYSPVYATMSGPSKLLANFSWELFWQVSITQVVYIAIFFSLGMLLQKLGSRRVTNYGG